MNQLKVNTWGEFTASDTDKRAQHGVSVYPSVHESKCQWEQVLAD